MEFFDRVSRAVMVFMAILLVVIVISQIHLWRQRQAVDECLPGYKSVEVMVAADEDFRPVVAAMVEWYGKVFIRSINQLASGEKLIIFWVPQFPALAAPKKDALVAEG